LAAQNGHEGCLRVLHELGAGATLSAEDVNKETPAHDAAQNGREGCLRLLHELGAVATLSAEDANNRTPAHFAALNGHEGCLRVLHELGAGASLSATDANKETPTHDAAENGHEGCLRVLHELGAGASLSATDANKETPAHLAAKNGHEGCLRVLHGCLSLMIDPLLKGLSQFRSAATITNAILELEAMRALALLAVHSDNMDSSPADDDGSTPAHDAAAAGHTSCVAFPVGNRRHRSAAARCAS
jgi:ankyrin repeat protein